MISRRCALTSLGALGFGALPVAPLRPATLVRPPRLRQGDAVGLIAPATFADDVPAAEKVAATLTAMGLAPKIAPHVTSRYGYLAGTDQERAADLNAMFADKSVRAIFTIHGGWGCARMLPFLDWRTIRANPKLLIGFSDVTALHLALAARAGFASIHGPNAANSWQDLTWKSLWDLAFAGAAPELRNPAAAEQAAQDRWRTTAVREGKASGRLLGGNLSVLAALVGTPWLPDFSGAILFLEDTGEAEYRIDRMLTQLRLAGILGKLSGIVFGQCTRCTTNIPGYSGFTMPQLMDQHLKPLGIPAFYGANIGHVANQFCVPVGARVEVDAGAGSIRVLEPIVA